MDAESSLRMFKLSPAYYTIYLIVFALLPPKHYCVAWQMSLEVAPSSPLHKCTQLLFLLLNVHAYIYNPHSYLRFYQFAQELLSTFSTALGEVSLIPCTGGVFTVTILHASTADFTAKESILWDRKTEGGFPEVKQLKALVRDIIEPSRSLGHIDRANAKAKEVKASGAQDTSVDSSAGDIQPSSTQGVDSSPSKTLPATDSTSKHTPWRSPREEKAESGRGIMGEGKENDTSAMEGEVCEDC
jgi:predicted Rdx family selenoprotein